MTLAAGEWLGVVGESGAGKSVLLRTVLGLLPQSASMSGQVSFEGVALSPAGHAALRGRRIAAIFQDPGAALNPTMPALDHVAEAVRVSSKLRVPWRQARSKAAALLERLGLRPPFGPYAHQLSGGMQQRVGIAAALAAEPTLLLADEPTSSLDSVSAGEIIQLLAALRQERRVACLWVTHEFMPLLDTFDRLLVMRAGEVVESGPAKQVVQRPKRDYTQALMRAARAGRGTRAGGYADSGDSG